MTKRTREPTRNASDHAWLLYLLLAAAAVGYVLLSGIAQNVLYILIGASMLITILAGIFWHRPTPVWPWYVIVFGLSFFVADAVFFIVYESVLGLPAPFPFIADVFYLGSHAITAVGLAFLVRPTAGRRATSRAESEFLPICLVAWERCPACSSAPGGVGGVVGRLAERLIHGNIKRLEKAV